MPIFRSRFRPCAPLVLGLFAAGCEGILDVDTSGVLTPDDLDAAGPSSIVPIINGVIYDYHEAVDDIVRYAAVFTDEMISAGSFDQRLQVDLRRIQPSNPAITNAVYTPLHQARHLADTTFLVLQSRLSNPDYSSVTGNIRAGMALSKLYGGYSRLWLGELYCWSILSGTYPESAPVLPDARMRHALQVLREAESAATVIGYQQVQLAALVGQARAHLWLGEYEQAAAVAARVPRQFVYQAEYSQNSPSQYNEVYAETHGDASPIVTTVGDGAVSGRGFEVFEHFEQFAGLNLIAVRPPGFFAQSSTIPVNVQLLYTRKDSEMTIASGVEALLIRAETDVRFGRTADAAALLNDLRSDYSFRVAVSSRVEFPGPGFSLEPITLTGNMSDDLKVIADERARELWLTGDRFTTSRRFRREAVGFDLFPPVKTPNGGGDDVAFPIAQEELDANPNLTSAQACPADQMIGSWR